MTKEEAITEQRESLLTRVDTLQRELNNIPQEIIRTKRKFNALAPISRLPVEIFCMIVMWCRMLKLRHGWEDFWPSDVARRAAIHVSHTCHMWRTLTLSFPKAWADIVFHGPNYFSACLERSQSLPSITIKFNADAWFQIRNRSSAQSRPIVERCLRAIRKELHRISRLVISCQRDLANDAFLFDQHLNRELPLLVDLDIDLQRIWTPSYPGPRPTFLFTEWLLTHSIPQLKRLAIRDKNFEWWQCRNFPSGLTCLCISMLDDFLAVEECTLDEVIACLGQLKSLESLTLSDALPSHTRERDMSESRRAVALTPMLRLKVLNLTSDFRSAVYFLVRLQLPPMVSVEISADIHNDWDTLVICADLIPFIKGETTLPSNKPLVSFGINCDRCPNVTFLGSRDYLSSLSSLPTDCHLTLNFETTGPFTLIIRSICETIHDELKHIRILLLGSVEDFDLDMFLAIFRASKHLVKLELTGQNALILPELLMLGPENRRNKIEKTFIFPELHSLIITSFEFKGSNFGGLAVDTFFKQLVQMIQTRQEHGLGLYEITFYDCTNFDGSGEVVKERLSSLVAITSISPMESPVEFGTYAECMEEADGEEEEEDEDEDEDDDDDDDDDDEDKLQ